MAPAKNSGKNLFAVGDKNTPREVKGGSEEGPRGQSGVYFMVVSLDQSCIFFNIMCLAYIPSVDKPASLLVRGALRPLGSLAIVVFTATRLL